MLVFFCVNMWQKGLVNCLVATVVATCLQLLLLELLKLFARCWTLNRVVKARPKLVPSLVHSIGNRRGRKTAFVWRWSLTFTTIVLNKRLKNSSFSPYN